ncbi:MAG: hypothetical protein ABUJ92_00330 [Desulfobacterales bacterium]
MTTLKIQLDELRRQAENDINKILKSFADVSGYVPTQINVSVVDRPAMGGKRPVFHIISRIDLAYGK